MGEAEVDGTECSRKVVSGRRVASDIRSTANTSYMQIESCMKRCLYLFLLMSGIQCYGRIIRDLGLELYRWTTSEAWLVLGGWIESRSPECTDKGVVCSDEGNRRND